MTSTSRYFRASLAATAAAAIAASIPSAEANGFRNPPPGGKALGMDGGKIAFIDDGTALTHNPANLADVQESSFHAAYVMVYPDAEFTGEDGRKGSPEDNVAILPNFYGIWPLQDGLVAGVGLTTPFGQQTEWDKASPFGPAAPYFARLIMVDLNPTISARLNDQLSVAAGANLYWSRLDMKQGYPWGFFLDGPFPSGTARLDGDGFGAGANLAATWKFADRQRLALTYRSAFDIDYEGDFKISEIPAPLAPVVAGRSDFESKIRYPSMVTLGYGIELSDTFRVGADVEWVEFSRYQSLPLDIGANNEAGLVAPAIPQDWKDIWTFGVAAEWNYDENSVLWLTYKFMETPIPDETYSPIIIDADRHMAGVGMGHRMGSHTIGYAYQANFLEDRTIRGNPNPAVNGTYESVTHLVSVSYQYTF